MTEKTIKDLLCEIGKRGWKVHFEGFKFGLGITVVVPESHPYLTHSRVVGWHDIEAAKLDPIAFSLERQIDALSRRHTGTFAGEGI